LLFVVSYARSNGALGGLVDPRRTSSMHLPYGSSQEVFPSSCGEGWALNWSNRYLDRFR
jgi:hypothetical protein